MTSLRHAGRTTTVAISIGLVAILGTDIAVAAHGGAAGATPAHRSAHSDSSAVRAYLTALRPIATQVASALGPAQGVLEAIVEPQVGDAFAARDAIANGDALSRLQTARKQLGSLHVPAAMARHQRALVTAAKQLTVSLTDVRALRSLINGNRILAKLDGAIGNRLGAAEGQWSAAVDDAYQSSQVAAPRDLRAFTHGASSGTKWIFGADRACSAATFKLAGLGKYAGVQSVSAAEQWDRLWARALAFAGHRLTALKQPTGASALPRLLQSRLKVLLFNSRLFTRQIAGLKQLSFASVEKADSQIHEVLPTLRLLASQMNRYGARSCGLIIGEWAGKRPPAPSNGHHSPLNT